MNDAQTNGAILEGLEYVFNLIARYEVLECLYIQRVTAAQGIFQSAIVQVYTAILRYLLDAYRYFNQKTIKRISRSILQLEEPTLKHLAIIKSKERDMHEYIQLILGEIVTTASDTVDRVETKLNLTRQQQESFPIQDKIFHENQAPEIEEMIKILRRLSEPLSRYGVQLSTIHDKLEAEHRLRILQWLSLVQYKSHHRMKAKELIPGSGNWFLKRPEFVEWLGSSSSSILWLHGIPGSGKSMLVARVIEYLKAQHVETKTPTALAYFYCARSANEPERSDPNEIMRSILEQLSSMSKDLPIREPVILAYNGKEMESEGRNLERLDLDESVAVALSLLESDPATIVIDGLDECSPTRRQDFLNALEVIISCSNNVVKILVSSRDDHDLVQRLEKTPNLYVNAGDNGSDIQNFIVVRVDEAISQGRLLCGKVSRNLRETIVETLSKKAEGMFRLVSLHIDSLCDPERIKTKANVLNALADLPRDLTKSYDTIMLQISRSQHPNPEMASRILNWQLHAHESLESSAFILAICVDSSEVLTRANVLSICCNLIVYDGFADTFRFAHLSVAEYLHKLEGYSSSEWYSFAAKQCLLWVCSPKRYIELTPQNSTRVDRQKTRLGRRSNKAPSFNDHSDCSWPLYVTNSKGSTRYSQVLELLEEFLLSEDSSDLSYQYGYLAWAMRIESIKARTWAKNLPQSPEDKVSVACQFNIVDLLPKLINQQNCSEAFTYTSSSGSNCAKTAIKYRQYPALRILLHESEKYNLPANYWDRLLFDATASFDFAAIRIILEGSKTNVGLFHFLHLDLKDFIRLVRKFCDHRRLLSLILNNMALHKAVGDLSRQFSSWNRVSNQIQKITSLALIDKTKALHMIETTLTMLNPLLSTLLLSTAAAFDYNHFFWGFGQKRVHNDTLRVLEVIIIWYNSWARQNVPNCKAQLTYFLIGCYAHAIKVSGNDKIMDIMRRAAEPDFELTWEDLHLSHGSNEGTLCIHFLLQLKPKIDIKATYVLLSMWDSMAVKHLLSFKKVEVTQVVIKAVAGNFRHGEKILQLLLDSEHESLLDNNYDQQVFTSLSISDALLDILYTSVDASDEDQLHSNAVDTAEDVMVGL